MNPSHLKIIVGIAIFTCLLGVPTPLLPPDHLAINVQRFFGIGWEGAYLATAVAVQSTFYASVGVLSSFLCNRSSSSLAGEVLQIGIVSMLLACAALIVRSVKAGHLPDPTNMLVPICACVFGVVLGFGLRHRRRHAIVLCACVGLGLAIWALRSRLDSELKTATQEHLQQFATLGSTLPSGDARFLALLQIAFLTVAADSSSASSVQHNRAAILAWGIALGHPTLARFVGVDPQSEVVRLAAAACEGTTLRDRSDWPRHYALSAALAVVQRPFISDAGGLMKEQLDALTRGSGFSFGDLAADRAGIRFAISATRSEEAAKAMRARILQGSPLDDFFPASSELPENLTVEQFRQQFGGVGSEHYRMELKKIDGQLDRCIALSPAQF